MAMDEEDKQLAINNLEELKAFLKKIIRYMR